MTDRVFLTGKHWIMLVLMLVSLLASPWVQAKTVSTLYEIALPCQSQQESERRALIEQGFLQVLGRVSADPQIATQPNVKKALGQLANYVELYSYEGQILKVRYNAAMIAKLLGISGSASWGTERPQVVLWLALEQNNDRHLVGAETDPAVHETLKNLAQQQGLPLVLPLMDLEDVTLVSVTDVWGQFTDVLIRASERYHAEVLLMGRVKQVANAWQGDWTMRYAGVPTSWHIEGSSLEAIMGEVLSKTAGELRNRLAVNTDPQQSAGQPLLIGIQGIYTRADFKNVTHYLQHLHGIKQAEVRQVSGNTAIFEVIPYGTQGKAVFAQLLQGEQRLLAPAIPNQAFTTADLVYEWEP